MPTFETAIEKKPTGELDRDAMFAKLKQFGGKTAGSAVVARIASSSHPLIAHRRGVGETEVVADADEHRIDVVAFIMGTISGARQPRARRMSARAAHRL